MTSGVVGISGRLLDSVCCHSYRCEFLLIKALGPLFLKWLKEAYEMWDKHRLIFQQFSLTFKPQMVQEWEAMVLAWKKDKSKPNPYLEPAPCSLYHSLTLLLRY